MGDLEPPTLSLVLRDLDVALLLPEGGPPVLVAGRRCRKPEEGEGLRCDVGVETGTPLPVCCRRCSGGSLVAGIVGLAPSAGLLLALLFPRLLVPYTLLPSVSSGGASTAIIIAVVEAVVVGIFPVVVVVAAAEPINAMLLLLGCSSQPIFSPSLPSLLLFSSLLLLLPLVLL